MQRINPETSSDTILNYYSAYTLSQLQANPELSDEATLALNGRDALKAAVETRWSAVQQNMAADAIRDGKKYRLDVALRGLRHAILSAGHNNRNSTYYTTAFPNGFADVIRSNADDELALARSILVKFADVRTTDIPQAVAALQAAVDDLATATGARNAARTAVRDATDALRAEKGRYAATYNEIRCRLEVSLGDWRLANTYFRRSPHAKAAQPQPTPQPQPVPQPQSTLQPQPSPQPASEPSAAPAAHRMSPVNVSPPTLTVVGTTGATAEGSAPAVSLAAGTPAAFSAVGAAPTPADVNAPAAISAAGTSAQAAEPTVPPPVASEVATPSAAA